MPKNNYKFFFLVGSPRSGTTILAESINKFDNIYISSETHWFDHYKGDLDLFLNSRHGATFLEKFSIKKPKKKDLLGLLEEFGNTVTKDQKASLFFIGEKTPAHIKSINKLIKMGKVVIIERDFWSVVKSIRSSEWDSKSLFRTVARISIERFISFFSILFFSNKVLKIKYEDLIRNPDDTLKKVLKFIDSSLEFKEKDLKNNIISTIGENEWWKTEASYNIAKQKKKYSIGAWPRIGETNPRNTLLYDHLQKDNKWYVFNLKKHPFEILLSDFIHIHWPEKAFQGVASFPKLILLLVMLVFKKLNNSKLVYTVHNDFRTDIKNKFFSSIFTIFLRNTDLFVLPSPASLNVIHKFKSGSSKWKLIPLGLYPNEKSMIFDPQKEKKTNILILGRLTEKKGILDSIKKILKATDLTIHVCGSPENSDLRNSLEDLYQNYPNRLSLELNFVEDERMKEVLTETDALLIDYSEGLNSGIITLALSINTPILCSNDKLVRDTLRLYGGNIRFFKKENFQEEFEKLIYNQNFKIINNREIKHMSARLSLFLKRNVK